METLGATVWLTGLSGSGKTTIAHKLLKVLRARGLKVEILDGDGTIVEFGQTLLETVRDSYD